MSENAVPLKKKAAAKSAAPDAKIAAKVEPKTTIAAPKPIEAPLPGATVANTAFDAFHSLRNEVDRVFERFWHGLDFPSLPSLARAVAPTFRYETSLGLNLPAVDVKESEKAFSIAAELPGMTEKDIEITLSGDILSIKGEKSEEREEKGRNVYLSERRFGSFQRSFALPDGVDRDKIEAAFDKGVLTVTLPKTADAMKGKRKVEIKGAK